MGVEPLLHLTGGVRDRGQDRGLVNDPLVQRRRLEEEHERVQPASQLVEVVDVPRALGQQLGGEDQRPLALQHPAQRVREQPVCPLAVDGEQNRFVLRPRRGGEMQRHQRGKGPVEQARGKPVVLGERQPVPGRGAGRLAVGVLAEVAGQVALELGVVAAQPGQAGHVRVARPGEAPEHERGVDAAGVPAELGAGDGIVELAPGIDRVPGHPDPALPAGASRHTWLPSSPLAAAGDGLRGGHRIDQCAFEEQAHRRARGLTLLEPMRRDVLSKGDPAPHREPQHGRRPVASRDRSVGSGKLLN